MYKIELQKNLHFCPPIKKISNESFQTELVEIRICLYFSEILKYNKFANKAESTRYRFMLTELNEMNKQQLIEIIIRKTVPDGVLVSEELQVY